MKSIFTLSILCCCLLASAQEFTHTDVTIPVEDKTTKAVLTLPAGDGPFPAMVIISGSGATDKDGNTYGMQGKNNSLKLLSEALAAKGYASLRYDKRIFAGFGEQTLNFDHFVTDAVSAFNLLNEHPKTSQVGIVGHSQGSQVGMLAAQQVNAAFYISIAGPGLAFDEIISKQLRANPANPKDLIEKAESIMSEMKKGNVVEDVPMALMSLFRPTVQSFIGSWMKHSPTEDIAKLDIPVLLVNGTTDIQVTEESAQTLFEAANTPKDILIVEGMNHILKTAPEERNANIATYTNPDLPIVAGLIDGIVAYLGKHLKK